MNSRHGYGHMVLDRYVERVRAIHERRSGRLRALRTAAAVRAYQAEVRRAVRTAFAPRPRQTPLNTQTTGMLERPGFRIEKLTFESRPGCLVTANLYVPTGLTGSAPGVVGPCGHSQNGKACELYSAFAQRLALNGFVVLVYDPFNQGERDQYAALPAREEVNGCCAAHNMMGKQLELVGEYFGMWRAWDGIRALDVLAARPEVDPRRIGVTGNSGGGTLSTWLWTVEDRFSMAAPSCFLTTFLHNLENELPADCEQYPPGILGAGFEMADLIVMRAPKPTLLLGQAYDYFDRRGLQQTYAEARRIYALLGAPENLRLFIGPCPHGYSVHNQEAMVAFFAEHARDGHVVRVAETEHFPDEVLQATPGGSVVAAGATPIYTLIDQAAEGCRTRRGVLAPAVLRRRVARLLGVSARRAVPHYRIPRPVRQGTDVVARYAVETERGIRAILQKRLEHTERAYTLDVEPEVHLYLPHFSVEADMNDEPLTRTLMARYPLYALDVRGLGESMPEEAGDTDFFASYGMDYMMHGQGLLLGESYLGRRVHDVLSTVELLAAEGAQDIRLYGRGQGALLALFAALLDDRFTHVVLKNAPLSYRDWTRVPLVAWPSANVLRGALKVFDLPDCMRAIAPRLQLIEPWGPDMKPLKGRALSTALDRAGLTRDLIARK